MPVEFLTDAKAGAYGRFPATVSDAQLAEYFHAAADEEAILGACRTFDVSPLFSTTEIF